MEDREKKEIELTELIDKFTGGEIAEITAGVFIGVKKPSDDEKKQDGEEADRAEETPGNGFKTGDTVKFRRLEVDRRYSGISFNHGMKLSAEDGTLYKVNPAPAWVRSVVKSALEVVPVKEGGGSYYVTPEMIEKTEGIESKFKPGEFVAFIGSKTGRRYEIESVIKNADGTVKYRLKELISKIPEKHLERVAHFAPGDRVIIKSCPFPSLSAVGGVRTIESVVETTPAGSVYRLENSALPWRDCELERIPRFKVGDMVTAEGVPGRWKVAEIVRETADGYLYLIKGTGSTETWWGTDTRHESKLAPAPVTDKEIEDAETAEKVKAWRAAAKALRAACRDLPCDRCPAGAKAKLPNGYERNYCLLQDYTPSVWDEDELGEDEK